MLGGGDCHKGRLVQDGLDAVKLELGTLELKALELDLDTSGVEVPILVLQAAAKNNPDPTETPAGGPGRSSQRRTTATSSAGVAVIPRVFQTDPASFALSSSICLSVVGLSRTVMREP
jgi:hypothetical protein